MKIAINEATTMPHSFEQDVKSYASAGFTAIELWLDKVQTFLEQNTLDNARDLLADYGLRPVGACFHFGVMLSEAEERVKNLDEFRRKLEICQALGVPVLVVPTDFPERNVTREDYDRAAEGLAEAADIAASHGVALAVEFIKGAKLVGTLRTALELARKTERKNVGILLDTFHLCVGASKLEDIDELKAPELLLVHINDLLPMPKEIAEDRDRTFPGDGVLPVREIMRAVSRIGYTGYFSLELFDESFWRQPCKEAAGLAFEKTAAFMEGGNSLAI